MKPKKPDSEVRRNLSKRWYNLVDRCTNPEHPRYAQYGGAGVQICEQWMDKEVFISDAKNLPGYSEKELLGGNLHLDKDTLVPNNKTYSPESCAFVPLSVNNTVKPNQMPAFIATSPNGEIIEGTNQSEFSRTHGLNQSKISACLRGDQNSVYGWTFKYK